MRGQAAVMDALFFMTICAGAATLLFFSAGLYGSSSNEQIITIYNYEYGNTALVAMHYAKDENKNWFWTELKNKLTLGEPKEEIYKYLDEDVDDALAGAGSNIWNKVVESAPTEDVHLCFYGTQEFCYVDEDIDPKKRAYTASVKIIDSDGGSWDVILKMLY